MERSISFKTRGRVPTKVTVAETDEGTLTFEVEARSGWRGEPDLRGLFFDLNGVDVNDLDLQVDGDDITGLAVCEGQVARVTGDVSVQGRGVRKHGAFDVGVALGSKGFGEDQITSTSFALSASDTDLTLDMLNFADIGLRYDTKRDSETGCRDRKDRDDGDRGHHKDHGRDHDNGFHKGHHKQHKSGHPGVGVAQNDVLSASENSTGSIDILDNDASVSGRCWSPSVKVRAVEGLERVARKFTGDLVSHDGIDLGTLTIHRSGEATFEARADALAEGEVREVPLRYTTGSMGRSKTAWVVVTVTGTNDAPEITIDGEENIEAALELGEIEVTADGTLTVTDVDLSDQVNAAVTGLEVSGTYDGDLPSAETLEELMTLNSDAVVASGVTDGELTWTFASTGLGVDIPQGETLVLVYQITVTDDQSAAAEQLITITLTGTQRNEPPVLSVEPGDTAVAEMTETDGALIAEGRLTVSDTPGDSVALAVVGVAMTGVVGSMTPSDCLAMLSLPGTALTGGAGTESFSWAFSSGNESFDFLGQADTLDLVYTIAATDGAGEVAYHDITLTITGTAEAPVLSAGEMQVSESGAAQTDLAALVTGGDTELTYDLIAGSSGGSAAVDGSVLGFDTDGAFEHLPSGEVTSLDLTLTVSDTFGNTSENTVTVSIFGENDAPIGIEDTADVGEDGPGIVIDVLGNDTDVDDGDTLSVAEFDASGVLGKLTLNADGTFTYDPDGAFDGLASDETAYETFTYRVADSAGAVTAPVSVTIQINGAHDAPIIGPGALDVTEGGAGQIDLSELVAGGETALGYEVIAGPSSGIATLDGSVLSFDTAGAFETLGGGETAQFEIAVAVNDTEGGTSENIVAVSVSGENDAPMGIDDDADVGEDSPAIVIDVLGNDVDPDANDALSVAEFDASTLLGLLVLNADGTFSYDPNGALEELALGEVAVETFTYIAADGSGAWTDPISVTITVEGAHDAPDLLAGALEVSESGSGQIDLAALVSGGETALSFDITTALAAGQTTVNGSILSFDTDMGYETLAAGDVAEFEIGVSVSDTEGGVSENVIAVTVVGENDAPIGAEDNFTIGEDGSQTVVDVLGNDMDIDDGDSLSVASFDASGILGVLALNSDGTFSYDPNGAFEALALGEVAYDIFTYRAADTTGALTDPITVTIQIDGAHDAPTLEEGTLSVDEGGTGQIDLGSLVSGAETELSFSVTGVPSGGIAGIDGSILTFETVEAFEHLGAGEVATFDIGVLVTDTEGGVAENVVAVTVTGENDAPIGVDDTADVGEDGPGIMIDVLGNDTDADFGDSLSIYEFDDASTLGLVALNSDNTFSYDPNGQFEDLAQGEVAYDTFTYRAVDGSGALSEPVTVTIRIDGAHDQAEIRNAGFESGLAGWDTVGTATTVGRQALISETGTVDPIEGSKMLRLYSLGAGDGTVANFLGQSIADLELADGDSDLIVGAAAKTVIENVAIGDVLSFDWFFDAGDNVAFDDSALMLTMNGDFVELSDVSDVGDWGSSGWQTTTVTATTGGDLTLAFAVFNAGDAGQNSALYVDDLQLL